MAGLIAGLVAACSVVPRLPPTPPPAITLNVQVVPFTPPPAPITWTPIPTLTPEPTYTPLPTETLTPTPDAAAICKAFGLVSAPASGAELAYDGTATFSWTGVPAGTRLSLTLTLHGGKQGIRLDVDAPGDNIVPIPLTRLPDDSSGRYDWRVWLTHPQYGELCVTSGYIIRKPLVIM